MHSVLTTHAGSKPQCVLRACQTPFFGQWTYDMLASPQVVLGNREDVKWLFMPLQNWNLSRSHANIGSSPPSPAALP